MKLKKSKNPIKQQVIVYSTEYCPWCHRAKEFLVSNRISFKEIDVGANEKAAREMIKKSGQRGVPVIEIGKKIIVGFDEPAIRQALGLKKKGFFSW